MRGAYNTEQREEVVSCLAAAGGKHLTAADICRALKQNGSSVSTATVYRQLDRPTATTSNARSVGLLST